MVFHKDIITILLTTVCNIDGGCHVNNWPYSCEANFRKGPEKCEPCEPGRYGCNCSQICPTGTFGLNCYFTCNCSDDEACDPKIGCSFSNETSLFTTARPYNTVSSDKKLNILNEVTISLLVSSAAVVFFSVLCAFILIRLSKRIYKRE
ncbi:cell death abnormality protein 1-like [Saccostrea cucullata]|uniref:cell death abnormality protein 1-like n=1 Tax=Saccostrea cuccullata TaxID=36930 RepID=UPI002ED0200D